MSGQTGMTEQEIRLDDLRLLKKIAAGGMAEVWDARQSGVEGFEKRVAVKVVLEHLSDNEEFVRMFLDEGRLAAQLDHPNICQIYKLGESEGIYYMAMEFIDGVTLTSILRQAAMRGVFIPFQHCCQILIGACSGLDYAHSCVGYDGSPLNLVHRDISPQNIMLSFNGTVKVVDFGIAKAATQVHHTQAGVMKGKYAYMSPEQATGKSLDSRSDIFALGVVLWELTTGHRLFRAENEFATLHKIIGGDYPRPSSYRDDVPAELDMIIMRALAFDPQQRFQDCGEMQMALEEFLLRHGLAAGTKRLAHYLRWITSEDPDAPPPPDMSSSVVSRAFESSVDSGLLTPSSPNQAVGLENSGVGLTPVGLAPVRLTPTEPASNSGIAYLTQSNEGEDDPTFLQLSPPTQSLPPSSEKKSRVGLWLGLLFLLLLIGGGVGIFLMYPSMFGVEQRAEAPKFKLWLINSEPRGAEIFVNGEPQGQTPKMLPFVLGKTYVLRFSAKGFEPYVQPFGMLSSEVMQKPLHIELKKETVAATYGTLILSVSPPDAQVALAGKKLTAVVGGAYKERVRAILEQDLSVKLKGYQSIVKTFRLKSDEQMTLRLRLKRSKKETHKKGTHEPRKKPESRKVVRKEKEKSFLVLHANVQGAFVFANGRFLGQTPLLRAKLRPGSYRIRLTKPGYRPWNRQLTLRVNGTSSFTVKMFARSTQASKPRTTPITPPKRVEPPAKRSKGVTILRVGSSPKSVVYLNGKKIGTTPIWSLSRPPGTYKIKFKTLKFRALHTQRLVLFPGKQKIFHRFLTGRLQALSRPQAKVYVGSHLIGMSNKGWFTVPIGKYTIRFVFPDGSVRFKTDIVVQKGERTRVRSFLK